MTESQAKRSRADDNGTVGAPPQTWTIITGIVESLSHDQLKSLVLEAVKKHHDVYVGVCDFLRANEAAEHTKVAAELPKVLSFDRLVEDLSNNLQVEYDNFSAREEYDSAFKVLMNRDIDNTIKTIVQQAGTAKASAGTRRNGLLALRNVGKSILDFGDTLASEIRKQYQYDDALVEGMKRIVKVMMNEEREAMWWVTSMGNKTNSYFASKLMELKEEADGYCCFEGLKDVLCMLEEKKDEND